MRGVIGGRDDDGSYFEVGLTSGYERVLLNAEFVSVMDTKLAAALGLHPPKIKTGLGMANRAIS